MARASKATKAAPAPAKRTPPKPKVEVYEDQGGGYRWRYTGSNRKIVACSGEAFAKKGNAVRAAASFAESLTVKPVLVGAE